MVKYKEATCSKCLGELLVPEYDKSDDFYCNSCAWSKVGWCSDSEHSPIKE
jgi:hypothetical protein